MIVCVATAFLGNVLVVFGQLDEPSAGDVDSTPGELRSHATLHSIGIEWDLIGDADHDAVCQVQYRVKGEDIWKQALPLCRVDYQWWYADDKAEQASNLFAGSILFLNPDTPYEVKLDLFDPDGGARTQMVSIRTRPIPRLPTDGRTFHVIPGSGGGDGSENHPFQGLNAAQAAARPGDTFLLHQGNYGNFTFNQSGTGGHYIVWKGAGDGDVILHYVEIAASHIWLEGLTLEKRGRGTTGSEAERLDEYGVSGTTGLKATGPGADVVIRRNTFTGFHYSILLSKESRDWYIADNVIVGDSDPISGGISGEGIELNHSTGHAVAYNRISHVADGISYPERNCDIYGNDIFDVSDDGLEPDYGYANNRLWGNRIYNYKNNAISFQPMKCGPWYIVRNQVIGSGDIFKFRVQDRFL